VWTFAGKCHDFFSASRKKTRCADDLQFPRTLSSDFLGQQSGIQYSRSPTSGIRSRIPVGTGFVLLFDVTAAIFALGLDANLGLPDIDLCAAAVHGEPTLAVRVRYNQPWLVVKRMLRR